MAGFDSRISQLARAEDLLEDPAATANGIDIEPRTACGLTLLPLPPPTMTAVSPAADDDEDEDDVVFVEDPKSTVRVSFISSTKNGVFSRFKNVI